MKTKELTLLFLLKDQQILLALKKRGFGNGKWNGVGGKVEEGEELEQAMIRECIEEIAVTPLDYKKVADIHFEELHEAERKTMNVHVFVCTKWQGEPSESEEMNPRWFNMHHLPYENMWSDDKYWLPEVIAGKKIEATFVLDDDNEVTDHSITILE